MCYKWAELDTKLEEVVGANLIASLFPHPKEGRGRSYYLYVGGGGGAALITLYGVWYRTDMRRFPRVAFH